MDLQTSDFYERYAAALTADSEARHSAMLAHIQSTLGAGACVLDVGSGSGRDVAAMLELGLDAFGVEPNAAMRDRAIALYPSLQGRLRPATLPRLGRPFGDLHPEGFDAVVCSAVLMHLDETELATALESLVSQLRDADADANLRHSPTLLISVPEMGPFQLAGGRDADGRRFSNHDPAGVEKRLASLGWSLHAMSTSHAALANAGTTWHTLVFRRDRNIRPART